MIRRFAIMTILMTTNLALATPQKSLNQNRWIALSPALVEIIFNLGMDTNLVGVSDFSDFPEAAKKITSVGAYTKPNIEKIIILKPNLVMLPAEGPEDVRFQLDRYKIPYKIFSMKNLKDIGNTAEIIANLGGQKTKGQMFKSTWNAKLNKLFKSIAPTASQPTPHVFIEIQHEPLMASGQKTFLNEIVSNCHGTNAIEQEGYININRERAVKEKIDMVLIADHFSNNNDEKAALQKWYDGPNTKESMITALNSNFCLRPGPRLFECAQQICAFIRGPGGEL